MAVTVRTQERPPIWRDATVLKWAAQIVLLITIGVIFVTLFNQAQSNLEARGITFRADFLDDPPLISVREGISLQPESGARALYTGVVNTLRVSISGIVAATIIGTIIGIARLSQNWIVKKLAALYIETIRNIPLLVQIFFWLAVSQVFTRISEFEPGKYWFLVTARGVSPPWVFPHEGFYHWLVFLVLGAIAGFFVHRHYFNKQLSEGGETYPYSKAFGTLVVFAIVGWFIHPIFAFFGAIWDGIASLFGAIPTGLLQVVLAAAAVAAAAWWIKRFLDSFRTPAGLGKITDDDWFRMIFAGAAGVFFAALFLFVGDIAGTMLNMIEAFFEFLGRKYDSAFTGDPLRFVRPAVEVRGEGGFAQLSNDGLIMTPGFFALWIGVTLYTASFIAEIVRGGILAVSKGQSEAGSALGLNRFQLLRFIVLPQAFRIILPPMGNQYLNLFKNTSLGIAVAFPDIVQVGQTLYNQTGMTFPVVLLWMAFFLTGSLILSSVVNYWNRRLKLVER